MFTSATQSIRVDELCEGSELEEPAPARHSEPEMFGERSHAVILQPERLNRCALTQLNDREMEPYVIHAFAGP